jgi:hypothetical protein
MGIGILTVHVITMTALKRRFAEKTIKKSAKASCCAWASVGFAGCEVIATATPFWSFWGHANRTSICGTE